MKDTVGPLVIAAFWLLFAIVWLSSVIWAYRDAKRRGKSGLLVALLVILLSWPIGLIAWLVFRPRLPNRRNRWGRAPQRA